MDKIKLPEISIIRNGNRINLDYEEMRDIYNRMELYYDAEDVRSYYEYEMGEPCPFTSDECYQIAEMALDTIVDSSDCYLNRVECFLYNIREFMERKANGN